MNKPRKQMTKDEYHARTHETSSTSLKLSRRDAVEYYDTYEEPDENKRRTAFEETKPMETGSIIHAVVLDGSPLRSVVGIYPDHDPRLSGLKTMSGKARDDLDTEVQKYLAKECGVTLDDFKSAKGGKELKSILAKAPQQVINSSGGLNSSAAKSYRESKPEYQYFVKRRQAMQDGKVASYETLQEAIAAIMNTQYHSIFQSEKVIREQPIFWTDELTGIDCRCCPDFLLIANDTAFVWDLKVSAYAVDFGPQMNKMDYHIQQGHYTAGVLAEYPDVSNVVYTFLAVQPTYPYHCTENKFQNSDLDRIHLDYRGSLAELKRRREENDWEHNATKETNNIQLWERTTKFV